MLAQIANHIADSDVLVAILTPSSINNKNVLEEIVRAHEKEKIIIPLVQEGIQNHELLLFLRQTLSIVFARGQLADAIDKLLIELDVRRQLPLSHQLETERFHALGSLQRSNLGRDVVRTVVESCTVYPYRFGTQNSIIHPILIAPNAFIPDAWTDCFLSGLAKLSGDLGDIVEIGIGTGIIPIVLSKLGYNFGHYFGFDIDPLATHLARINIDMYGLSNKVDVGLAGDLFEPENSLSLRGRYADIIVANVPQVPSLSTGTILDYFDYYTFPKNLNGDEKRLRNAWPLYRVKNSPRGGV